MDDVSVDGREQVAPVAESTLRCGEKKPLWHLIPPARYWLTCTRTRTGSSPACSRAP